MGKYFLAFKGQEDAIYTSTRGKLDGRDPHYYEKIDRKDDFDGHCDPFGLRNRMYG